MKETQRKPVKLGVVTTCLFGLPLILIAAVFSIPWMACAVLYQRIRERHFYLGLKAKDRVLGWKQVECHLVNGEGTLVIEQANKNPTRIWWTPDDLFISGPAPPVEVDDLGLDYMKRTSSIPFVKWCFANYLAVEGGKHFSLVPISNFLRGR